MLFMQEHSSLHMCKMQEHNTQIYNKEGMVWRGLGHGSTFMTQHCSLICQCAGFLSAVMSKHTADFKRHSSSPIVYFNRQWEYLYLFTEYEGKAQCVPQFCDKVENWFCIKYRSRKNIYSASEQVHKPLKHPMFTNTTAKWLIPWHY